MSPNSSDENPHSPVESQVVVQHDDNVFKSLRRDDGVEVLRPAHIQLAEFQTEQIASQQEYYELLDLVGDEESPLDQAIQLVRQAQRDPSILSELSQEIARIEAINQGNPGILSQLAIIRRYALASANFATERERLRPQMLEEISAVIERIYPRISWDRIISQYESDSEARSGDEGTNRDLRQTVESLYYLQRVAALQRDGQLGTLHSSEIDTIYSQAIEIWHGDWEENGFLNDELNEDGQRKSEGEASTLEDVMQGFDALYNSFNTWENAFRFYKSEADLSGTTIKAEVRAFEGAISSFQSFVSRWESKGFSHDPRFINTLMNYIQRKQTQLEEMGIAPQRPDTREAYLERIKAESNPNQVENIKIENQGKGLMEREEVVSRIRAALREDLPVAFLQKVRSIVGKRGTGRNLYGGQEAGFASRAYDQNANLQSIDIEIIEDYFDIWLEERNKLIEIPEQGATDEIISTIEHEIAHGVAASMTLDELLEWEQVAESENVFVTQYVFKVGQAQERVIEEGELQGTAYEESEIVALKRRKTEDFCEVLMLYCREPARLQLVAPNRYAFMEKYFLDYLPNGEKEAFRLKKQQKIEAQRERWKQEGWTEAQLRLQYRF